MNSKKMDLCNLIQNSLSKNKAKEITVIDLQEKTSIADFMIICTGNSNRHIIALSNYLSEDLKKLIIPGAAKLQMINRSNKYRRRYA